MPTTSAPAKRFRVVCTEAPDAPWLRRATQAAAQRKADELNQLNGPVACREWHTVEQLVDGEWLALHVVKAREILAAKTGTSIDGPDGALIKNTGGWSVTTAQAADAAGEAGSPEWWAALGQHETATLSADGRGVVLDWCRCEGAELDHWVRYERWSERGREAHGYVHRECRRITQSG